MVWDVIGIFLCTLTNTKGNFGGGSENHYVKLIINPLFKIGLLWYNAYTMNDLFIDNLGDYYVDNTYSNRNAFWLWSDNVHHEQVVLLLYKLAP
jgi:hypothetical protein